MLNLIKIFNHVDKLDSIISMKYGINKKTGEQFAKATFDDGKSLIRKITKSGIVSDESISIPKYNDKKSRNKAIKELKYQGRTQDEIASYLDISQSTVSKVLKKK